MKQSILAGIAGLVVASSVVACATPTGGDEVLTGSTTAALRIATADDYFAGGAGLFARNPNDGNLYAFDGANWSPSPVGGPGRQFVVNDVALYGLAPDGSQIWQLQGGRWTPIESNGVATMIAGGSSLFDTSPVDGSLWMYSDRPNQWVPIGLPGKQFVANKVALYGLSADRSQIWQYANATWTEVSDRGGATLYAGGDALFATDSANGDIYRYTGGAAGGMTWQRVGGPGLDFAVSAHDTLYGITVDGNVTLQYNPDADRWDKIGGRGSRLYVAGDTLYEFNPDSGDLYRYEGKPELWTRVGVGNP